MLSPVVAVVSAVVEFLVAVAGNLFAADIEGWLPFWADSIIHSAAEHVPVDQREQLLEDWLANVRQIPGAVSKFGFALSLRLWGARRIATDAALPSAEGRERSVVVQQQGLVRWTREAAILLILPTLALELLFRAYPLGPSRYAAYVVLLTVIFGCALCLAAMPRHVLAVSYEGLNYHGRVFFGGLTAPAICVFLIALALIPASPRSATWLESSPEVQEDGGGPAVFYLAELPPSNHIPRLVFVVGKPQAQERLLEHKPTRRRAARRPLRRQASQPTSRHEFSRIGCDRVERHRAGPTPRATASIIRGRPRRVSVGTAYICRTSYARGTAQTVTSDRVTNCSLDHPKRPVGGS